MALTYEPIATTTLGSSNGTITFSSISSAYTDLRVVFVCTGTGGSTPELTFNNDTATNYSSTYIGGNGTATESLRQTSASSIYCESGQAPGISTTVPSLFTIDVFSYAGSTNKTCLITAQEDRNGSGTTQARVGLWRSTSAINRLDIKVPGNTFSTGSTFTLYGIKSA